MKLASSLVAQGVDQAMARAKGLSIRQRAGATNWGRNKLGGNMPGMRKVDLRDGCAGIPLGQACQRPFAAPIDLLSANEISLCSSNSIACLEQPKLESLAWSTDHSGSFRTRTVLKFCDSSTTTNIERERARCDVLVDGLSALGTVNAILRFDGMI